MDNSGVNGYFIFVFMVRVHIVHHRWIHAYLQLIYLLFLFQLVSLKMQYTIIHHFTKSTINFKSTTVYPSKCLCPPLCSLQLLTSKSITNYHQLPPITTNLHPTKLQRLPTKNLNHTSRHNCNSSHHRK